MPVAALDKTVRRCLTVVQGRMLVGCLMGEPDKTLVGFRMAVPGRMLVAARGKTVQHSQTGTMLEGSGAAELPKRELEVEVSIRKERRSRL